VAIALGALVLGASGGTASAYEIDYATYDAVVTDIQGVVTEVSDLGFWAGANILTARRGEAVVEIPLRKVHVIEMGPYHAEKGVYSCTITTRAGQGRPAKSIPCQIERMEGQRTLGGDSDLGAFRIRLQQIRRLELVGFSHSQP
jgi:hypothetical protein